MVDEELFLRVTNDPRLEAEAAEKRRLYDSYWEAFIEGDEEEAKKRKAKYQAKKSGGKVWFFQGTVESGKNIDDPSIVPTGLFFLDFDARPDPAADLAQWLDTFAPTINPNATEAERIAMMCHTLAIYYLARSTNGNHGWHIVALADPQLDIAHNQARMAQTLGLRHDPSCSNMNRATYVVPMSQILFYDKRLFLPQPIPPDGGSDPPKSNNPPSGNSLPKAASPPKLPRLPKAATPATDVVAIPQRQEGEIEFRGVKMAAIVEKLWEVTGGPPCDGERHNRTKTVTWYLRHICENNAERTFLAITSYDCFGLPDEEIMSLCLWVCRQETSTVFMPRKLREALTLAGVERYGLLHDDSTSPGANIYTAHTPPPLPDRLPPLIAAIIAPVPDVSKPSVAQGIFPALASYLYNVSFRYINNKVCPPALMNVTLAKSASGKGDIDEPIAHVMRKISEADARSREREDEWKETCKTKGANKEKPKKPEGIVVQYVSAAMTQAALNLRLKEASGRPLYSYLQEIEQFEELQGNQRNHLMDKIIRNAFDWALFGQERAGIEAISAMHPLRWNWNASTTLLGAQRFFRNSIANGTLSRVSFGFINSNPYDDLPVSGDYASDYDDAIEPFIDNLVRASGEISSDDANRLAWKLFNENKDFASQSGDEVFENFSRRANVIAFRKAMILFIANGQQWDPTFDDFIAWTMHTDLWVKMRYFGEIARKEFDSEALQVGRGPLNILTMLPDTFTLQQLQDLRQRQGMTANATEQLKNWRKRGYIEKVDDATFKKIQKQQQL